MKKIAIENGTQSNDPVPCDINSRAEPSAGYCLESAWPPSGSPSAPTWPRRSGSSLPHRHTPRTARPCGRVMPWLSGCRPRSPPRPSRDAAASTTGNAIGALTDMAFTAVWTVHTVVAETDGRLGEKGIDLVLDNTLASAGEYLALDLGGASLGLDDTTASSITLDGDSATRCLRDVPGLGWSADDSVEVALQARPAGKDASQCVPSAWASGPSRGRCTRARPTSRQWQPAASR